MVYMSQQIPNPVTMLLSQQLVVVGLLRGLRGHNHSNTPLSTVLSLFRLKCTASVRGPKHSPGHSYTMTNGNNGKSGRKSMRDWATAKVRNIGQHLSIPSSKRKSRSPSPAPSSSSSRKPQPEASITPYPQALSTTNTPPITEPRAPDRTLASSAVASPTGAGSAISLASSTTIKQPAADPPTLVQTPPTLVQTPPTPTPTLTALPQTLSPLEIRQLTAGLLKNRLTPEEVEEIKWDETTEEQAKAVVEEVQKSLEGKPDHTGKMYKTLQYVNQYSKIIDVAIQHQPCITALVWAGVRTVIQVCGNFLFVNLYPRHYEISQRRQFGECAGRSSHRAWICLFGYFPHAT